MFLAYGLSNQNLITDFISENLHVVAILQLSLMCGMCGMYNEPEH